MSYFILENGEPVQVEEARWRDWMQDALGAERAIGEDVVAPGCTVKTVFVGTPDALFETFVLGPNCPNLLDLPLPTWCYRTLLDAKEGHVEAVRRVRIAIEGASRSTVSVERFIDFGAGMPDHKRLATYDPAED